MTSPPYVIRSFRGFHSFLIQFGLCICSLFFSYSSSCSKFICQLFLSSSFHSLCLHLMTKPKKQLYGKHTGFEFYDFLLMLIRHSLFVVKPWLMKFIKKGHVLKIFDIFTSFASIYGKQEFLLPVGLSLHFSSPCRKERTVMLASFVLMKEFVYFL